MLKRTENKQRVENSKLYVGVGIHEMLMLSHA
jgi:hypothetical protein